MKAIEEFSFKPTHSGTTYAGSVKRPFGDLAGDYVNVKSFGAVGDGVANDTAAIQAAIDWTTSNPNRGIIFFPMGVYKVVSSLLLDNPAGSGTDPNGVHSVIKLMGVGPNMATHDGASFITGNFADYIFKRANTYNTSGAPKIFEGLAIANSHAAGGGVFVNANGHTLLQNCCVQAHFGVVFDQMNAPHGLLNCNVTWSNNTDGSIGIHLSGTGGFAQGCDVTGYDSAITCNQGGVFIAACRMEVNNIGINLGVDTLMSDVGTSGFQVTSCTFEANNTAVRINGGPGSVNGIQVQGSTNAPKGISTYGVLIKSATGVQVVSNQLSGGFCQGAVVQDPGGASGGGNVFTNNAINAGLNISGSYSAGATVITILLGSGFTMPAWIVDGLKVTDNFGGVVPAGTTISSHTTTTITLSAALTGAISAPFGYFNFFDPVTGFPVGNFYFPQPAGDKNLGTGMTTVITGNATLDQTFYDQIQMNSAGAITLTINNDAAFAPIGSGFLYKIIQMGAGAATIAAGTATVNGLGNVTTGQYKVTWLQKIGTSTWLAYQ